MSYSALYLRHFPEKWSVATPDQDPVEIKGGVPAASHRRARHGVVQCTVSASDIAPHLQFPAVLDPVESWLQHVRKRVLWGARVAGLLSANAVERSAVAHTSWFFRAPPSAVQSKGHISIDAPDLEAVCAGRAKGCVVSGGVQLIAWRAGGVAHITVLAIFHVAGAGNEAVGVHFRRPGALERAASDAVVEVAVATLPFE
eukprot:3921346-Rhodomonas_salina.3